LEESEKEKDTVEQENKWLVCSADRKWEVLVSVMMCQQRSLPQTEAVDHEIRRDYLLALSAFFADYSYVTNSNLNQHLRRVHGISLLPSWQFFVQNCN